MSESNGWMLLGILGLTVISVVTRSFFFISEREWRLPRWAQRGLQYAPIAALAAVIGPDILLEAGQLTPPWREPRVWGALAAGLYYAWGRRRNFVLPLTIAAGLAVYLPLRLLS